VGHSHGVSDRVHDVGGSRQGVEHIGVHAGHVVAHCGSHHIGGLPGKLLL